jgi:hypothetical protein
MAELAVRLGSFVNYDRRGEVIWSSAFNDGGRGFTKTSSGAVGEAYLSSDNVEHGGLVLVLLTDSNLFDFCRIEKAMRFPHRGGVGIELSAAVDKNCFTVWIFFILCDGTYQYEFILVYTHATGIITVLDSTGAYPVVGTCGLLYDDGYTYAQIKMVVDTSSGKYVKIMVNEHEFNARAIVGRRSNLVDNANLKAYIRVSTSVANFTQLRVSHVIITQNEPV